MQLAIDYTNRFENNSESQAILNANSVHINGQCKKVLDLLNKGYRLTVREAMLEYGISSLPRRILDLKEKLGIDIKSELIEGRFKEYYL